MANVLEDARLRELAFLAKLEREGSVKVDAASLNKDPAQRSLVVHLLQEGLINGLETVPFQIGEITADNKYFYGKPALQLKFEDRLWDDVGRALANQEVFARISHKGRVRRSELEQALRTGRDREPFGILWAERHRDQAVMMAVLQVQPTAPVSLAYLDMNGLKAINDANDHAAGDVAIRTYLQTIAMLKGETAEAFRSGGADEVVVVMRGTSGDAARDAMSAVLRQLGKERVRVGEKEVAASLTAACGIVTTGDPRTDAAAFVMRADAQQKRAKEASRVVPRASFLAVEGREIERVSSHG